MRFSRWMFKATILMAATLTVIAVLMVPVVAVQASEAPQGAVTARTAYHTWLRAGPGTHYARLILVPPSTSLPALGRDPSSSWAVVEYNGQRGWMAAWLLTFGAPVSQLPVVQNAADAPAAGTGPAPGSGSAVTAVSSVYLRIRSGPGTGWPTIVLLLPGTPVDVLARHPVYPWLGVEHEGKRGWVYAQLLEITGDVSSLPTTTDLSNLSVPVPAPPPPTGEVLGYSPLVWVGEQTDDIFAHGQALGNHPNRFTKVGDSMTYNNFFLTGFDYGDYDLGRFHAYQPIVDYYSGSWAHTSQATFNGFFPGYILGEFWANPEFCLPGESRLECEYRSWQPSVALIMMRDHPPFTGLREIIEISLDYGVIPVMSTIPNAHGLEELHAGITQLTAEYQIPLWDLATRTDLMPNRGIGEDELHLTRPPVEHQIYLTDEGLGYAMTVRNIEALHVLYTLYHQVGLPGT